jgi:DNA-binding NarL/FixJ family response regulator
MPAADVTVSAVVVEGAAATVAVEQACAELSDRGLRIQPDWRAAAPGVVWTGLVRDEDDAQHAVLAALAGAHVVLAATAERDVIDRMCEDLRRLGPLDHRIVQVSQAPALSGDEQALVDRLLAGESLGQAAATLHLSRRTADRRLASARRALGVATTAELLAVAARSRR